MTLTKEWLLKTISELEEERDATPGAVNEEAAMALAAMKRALASLTAEPVCYLNRFTGRTFTLEQQPGADKDMDVYVPLYTAPPAPVSVPACFVRFHEVIKNRHHGRMPEELQIAFDECAAMLQGAEPVTTAYKLPEGWVAVPVEPTAEMISSGIAAHYERSQIQINDRPAPGPMECAYMAMLAAAPQQEAGNG